MIGVLGSSNPAAETNVTLYQVPTGLNCTANINVCNRGTEAIKVRISLSVNSTPTEAEYIEYDCVVQPGGVLERSAIVLQAGRRVIVRSDKNTASFTIYGIEE